MKIMGIDPSTKTGVALVESGAFVKAYSELEMKKMTGFERVSGLVGGVMSFHEKHSPDLVILEDMFVGHASSAVTIIQIGSILRYFLWQEGIPYLDVPATTLKKFVSGKGTSKKEEMMMHVQKRWGFTSPTNNIADAVGLGMFGLCFAGEDFGSSSNACVASLKAKLPSDVSFPINTQNGGL